MDYDVGKKRIVIADLDGTLTLSKTTMDRQMSDLICELLNYKDFAVISGGAYRQFQKQFLGGLSCNSGNISRLYLFPTNATSFYKFDDGEWSLVYSELLKPDEKKRIVEAFGTALKQARFEKPAHTYGEQIEDRGSQVTFSAFGQETPLEIKGSWDPDGKKRLVIKGYLDKLIPEFEVRIGGTSSIDVTKKGIDKAYGIRKINENLGYSIGQMLFLGDALFEGGNDYPVKRAGVDSISVSGPEETKKILREIIDMSKNSEKGSHTSMLLKPK
ncbi:MAG: HAD-IIB family hydrolase [Candidatus Micrarchaeota archaeon]|nr:HAD-IIB family hydrolase [Candidatus Micrarchaeota archaeon]MDE1823860.1 HAD-IIB family hydrolase [Candidatus Micrarchaeota archaeon]MDE1849450.1 HAD-IIB family hydrolase [Candidatus Micrarchaeota archaeon]